MLKPISYIHYNESAALDFSLRAVPERVGSLTDYPSRTATDVERPIAGFKSAPVMPVASQCKHLLFVSLIVFLVACQKPETEKLKKLHRLQSRRRKQLLMIALACRGFPMPKWWITHTSENLG